MSRKKNKTTTTDRKSRFKKEPEVPPINIEETVEIPKPKRRLSLFKLILIILFVIFVFLFAVVGTVALVVNQYIKKFETTAGISRTELFQNAREGINTSPVQSNGHKNILLLGTDTLSNREGDPIMTDTIMLLSLELESGTLAAVSLPRDLWQPEYQTKINALYHYGKDRYPEKPEQFSTEVLSTWIGVPIHHTIVISLDEVAELIDLVGGVQVEIQEGFIDEKFPQSDVDIRTETDPDKLYETVMFTAGSEVMSGQRALKYIRSRKSSDENQGTDDARAFRQQQIIGSVIEEVNDPTILKRPDKLGRYFGFYRTYFENYIALPELIATGYQLRDNLNSIKFAPTSLSIEADNQAGVLTHPPVEKYGQWVYEANDQEKLKQEVQDKLGLL